MIDLIKLLLDAVEVRSVLTLAIGAAFVAAVFLGIVDAKGLEDAFLLVMGFYFGAKATTASQPPDPPAPPVAPSGTAP